MTALYLMLQIVGVVCVGVPVLAAIAACVLSSKQTQQEEKGEANR